MSSGRAVFSGDFVPSSPGIGVHCGGATLLAGTKEALRVSVERCT